MHLQLQRSERIGPWFELVLGFRGEYSHASYMRVTTAQLIFKHNNLQDVQVHEMHCLWLLGIVKKVECRPSMGLCKDYYPYVLEIVNGSSCADADFGWGVGFIRGVIHQDRNFMYSHSPREAETYRMWLRAITLPESLWILIMQTVGAKSILVRGHSPAGEVADA